MRKLRLISLAYFVVFGTSCVMLCSRAAAAPDVLGKHKLAIQKTHWNPATGTWYGDPNGAGNDGGACGYGSDVKQKPFRSKVSAGSADLFKEGGGCGSCYQIKCTDNPLCSAKPVTVVITDECLGGPPMLSNGNTHFDLSGTAFGRLASDPSRASQMRNAGVVSLLFKRTPCEYPGHKIHFRINEGSNPYWFAFLVEYEDGDGDLGAVSLKQANSNLWQAMQKNSGSGADWYLRGNQPSQASIDYSLYSKNSHSR